MTQAQMIERWLEEAQGGYTVEQLKEAFQVVRNSGHWKENIDAVVDADLGPILRYAVPWFTGGMAPDVEDLGNGKIRVTAAGYWSNGMEG